jgi:hypothetical protein
MVPKPGRLRFGPVCPKPHLRADAPLFDRAGAVVLDQDVGVGDEPLDHLDAEGRAQVRRHRFLAAIDGLVIQADAVLDLAPAAHFIAVAGPFDLDHVGPEIREEHRAQRRGQEIGDVDDLGSRHGHGPGRLLDARGAIASHPACLQGNRRRQGRGPERRAVATRIVGALSGAFQLCVCTYNTGSLGRR